MTGMKGMAVLIACLGLLSEQAWAGKGCEEERTLERLWLSYEDAVKTDASNAKSTLAKVMRSVRDDGQKARDAAFGTLNAIKEARRKFADRVNQIGSALNGVDPNVDQTELIEEQAAKDKADKCLQASQDGAQTTVDRIGEPDQDGDDYEKGSLHFADKAASECGDNTAGNPVVAVFAGDKHNIWDSRNRCRSNARQAIEKERVVVEIVQGRLARPADLLSAACVQAGPDAFGVRARLQELSGEIARSQRELLSYIGRPVCERNDCPPTISPGLSENWEEYFAMLEKVGKKDGVSIPMEAWESQRNLADAANTSANADEPKGLNFVDSTTSLLHASYHADKAKEKWHGNSYSACYGKGRQLLGALSPF